MKRGVLAGFALLLLACLLCGPAWARPGGGSTFGGGSSGGGGGSSGGSSIETIIYAIEFLYYLVYGIYLLFAYYPKVGIGLTLVVGGVVIWALVRRRYRKPWDSARKLGAAAATRGTVSSEGQARRALEKLAVKGDPNFSLVLFEDFLYALYARVEEARAKPKDAASDALSRLDGYLTAEAGASLRKDRPDAVKGVVIGAQGYVVTSNVGSATEPVRVRVRFETNYTEVRGGKQTTYYARELWTLSRQPGVVSPEPSKVRDFGCPNCGAALVGGSDTCASCGQTVRTGAFDWQVVEISVSAKEDRGPSLTTEVTEQGTDNPTVVDSRAQKRLEALRGKDAGFDWDQLRARVELVFQRLQVAWSTRDWLLARPFVSDNLFQMQQYWIDMYKREQLKNITRDATIGRIELSRVTSDRFFDSITVRLFASSYDFTERETGELVCGSRTQARDYTEYWTFIRGAGTKGAARADLLCPNCGAALTITMAGDCESCQARVTAGQFDWVLSRIEQDDSYGG